jgi:diamine N-acetyltransferase
MENYLNIRQATPSDLVTIQTMGCKTYREHFSLLWSPHAIDQFLHRDFSYNSLTDTLDQPDKFQWLIASDANDIPVGFSKMNWSKAEPISGVVGAELQKIYFYQSAAGKGYGHQLLRFILLQAKNMGESIIWLEVLQSNLQAQRFYERAGFKKSGRLPYQTDLKDIGMTVMIYNTSF